MDEATSTRDSSHHSYALLALVVVRDVDVLGLERPCHLLIPLHGEDTLIDEDELRVGMPQLEDVLVESLDPDLVISGIGPRGLLGGDALPLDAKTSIERPQLVHPELDLGPLPVDQSHPLLERHICLLDHGLLGQELVDVICDMGMGG